MTAMENIDQIPRKQKIARIIYELSICFWFCTGIGWSMAASEKRDLFEWLWDIYFFWTVLTPLCFYLVFVKWLKFRKIIVPFSFFLFAAIIYVPTNFALDAFSMAYANKMFAQSLRELTFINACWVWALITSINYFAAFKNKILFYLTLLPLSAIFLYFWVNIFIIIIKY